MGKKGNHTFSKRGGHSDGRYQREIRTSNDIARDNRVHEADNDSDGCDDSDQEVLGDTTISVNICLWEFGQNDPKRDSGSKMVRLGYASRLKIGQSFPGIVLSSEASICVSPADREIVEKYGIAGINCSWNRLEEIPFDQMGKGRNQRLLPLLFAANSVNYGRPYKMNTAEATAACLYITGFKDEARRLLAPFGYGEEFLRLNMDGLERYSECSSSAEVLAIVEGYKREDAEKKQAKETKKAEEEEGRGGGRGNIGGYMDDMDLPPMDDEYEYGYGEEGEEYEGN